MLLSIRLLSPYAPALLPCPHLSGRDTGPCAPLNPAIGITHPLAFFAQARWGRGGRGFARLEGGSMHKESPAEEGRGFEPLSLHPEQSDWQLIGSAYDHAVQCLCSDVPRQAEGQAGPVEAVALFCARYVSQLPAARRRWPLSRIAAVCGISLFELFQELPTHASELQPFLEAHGLSWASMEADCGIREWQNSLVSITLLSRKYKDLVAQLLPRLETSKPSVLRLGWFLFITLKAKLLPPFPDLVSCMTLLACVLAVMVAHQPSSPPVAPTPGGHSQPMDVASQMHLLQGICGTLKVDPASAGHQAELVNSLLLHLLPSFVLQWRVSSGFTSQASTELGLGAGGRLYEGLLTDATCMAACCEGLEREYGVLFGKQGEIDERELLFNDSCTPASPRLSPRSPHNSAKRLHMTPFSFAPLAQPPNGTPQKLAAAAAPSPNKPYWVRGAAAPPGAGTGGGCTPTVGPTCTQPWHHAPAPAASVQAAGAAAGGPCGRQVLPGSVLSLPGISRPSTHGASANALLVPHQPHAQAVAQALEHGGPPVPSPRADKTPVSMTMAAAAWLRNVVGPAGAPPQPSPELHAMLEALGGSGTSEAVLQRAVSLAGTALPVERPDERCEAGAPPLGSHGGEGGRADAGGRVGAPRAGIAVGTGGGWKRATGPATLMGFPSVVPLLMPARSNDAVKLYLLALQAMLTGEAQVAAAATAGATPPCVGASADAVPVGRVPATAPGLVPCQQPGEERGETVGMLVSSPVPVSPPSADAGVAGAGIEPLQPLTGSGSQLPSGPAGSTNRADAAGLAASAPCAPPGPAAQAAAAQKLLLNSPKFHRSLMACCTELVVAAHRMTTCTFPFVLDRLGLPALDLLRILQPFARYIPGLPLDLRHHLMSVEERIVESLAWQPGSPLYMLITEAAADVCAPAPSAGSGTPTSVGRAASSPTDSSADVAHAREADAPSSAMHASLSGPPVQDAAATGCESMVKGGKGDSAGLPPCPSRPADLAAPQPPQRPPHTLPRAIGNPPAPGCSALLLDFLHRVSRLASFRLALLVDALPLGPSCDPATVHAGVLNAFEHALFSHTHLFYNRHVDQVLLATLYGYCRAGGINHLTFNDVVYHYRAQQQAAETVFRAVPLEQSWPTLVPQSHGDIIAFYNQCFVPHLRPFLLQHACMHSKQAGDSSAAAGSTGDQGQDKAVDPAKVAAGAAAGGQLGGRYHGGEWPITGMVLPFGRSNTERVSPTASPAQVAVLRCLSCPTADAPATDSGEARAKTPRASEPGPFGSPRAPLKTGRQPHQARAGEARGYRGAVKPVATKMELRDSLLPGLEDRAASGVTLRVGSFRAERPARPLRGSWDELSGRRSADGEGLEGRAGPRGVGVGHVRGRDGRDSSQAGASEQQMPRGIAALLWALDSAEAEQRQQLPTWQEQQQGAPSHAQQAAFVGIDRQGRVSASPPYASDGNTAMGTGHMSPESDQSFYYTGHASQLGSG